MRYIISILFLLSTLNGFSQKSIIKDSLYVIELKLHIDSIYNYQFENSENTYMQMLNDYPNHPFPDLYYALAMYWKYFPITPNSEKAPLFVEKLNSSIAKAENYFAKQETNESIFFNLMGRLLLMQYFSDNQTSANVFPHIKPAYKMLHKGFRLEDSFSDFKFSSGVYNYYREYYPKAHPIYKPIAYFFPKGNALKGIALLETNSQKGIFLHKESLSFLIYINLYFEKNYRKALKYTKQIRKESPDNLLYLSYHTLSLLLLKKYNKAKALISILEKTKHSNNYFKAIAHVFNGIIAEKKYKDYTLAKTQYSTALKKLERYENFANTYKSIAYFGLSRIYLEDATLSNKYRKKARKLAIFSHINFD